MQWRNLAANFGTNASGATRWPNFEPMHVVPPGDPISNWCKWLLLVIIVRIPHLRTPKFGTNESGANLWPNLEMQSGGHLLFKRLLKFWVRCSSGFWRAILGSKFGSSSGASWGSREHFNTNEHLNIFISKHFHKHMSKYIHVKNLTQNQCLNIFLLHLSLHTPRSI